MAGNTISITFKLEGDNNSFKQLAADAEGLKKAVSGAVTEVAQLKGNVINFAALSQGIEAAQRSFSQLRGAMQELADAYGIQETAERKLETVMRQRMGATDEEIQSIKDFASAQQEIGVIGDEVQLSGAQQVATFLKEKSSLDTLIPAMNNLIAQQKGLNATTGDAVSVANLMGKAMQGQTSALTRVGITFTDAQANVMKYGTETERAAMLAQIITDNVGNMNEQLAQTDSGRQQQLANTLGDLKEQAGALLTGSLPFVTWASEALTAVGSISTLIAGMKTLTTTLWASIKAFGASTAAYIKNKGAALALAAGQKIVTVATAAWTAVQKVLNLVLTANPIGMVITAVGTLVAALIAAYNNCEGFRKIVDQVWASIKPLATAIMNGLAKAFEWLVEKCKEAWDWLKNILGLGGKKVEVAVEVSRPKSAPAIDLGAMEAKYANHSSGGKAQKAPKISTPKSAPLEVDESAATLEAMEANIDALHEKLKTASLEEAAIINRQIAYWEEKADAIRKAGVAAVDNTPLWKEDANTIKDINNNIRILEEQLQTATLEEAAELNQKIEALTKERDAIQNAGKALQANTPIWHEHASTIKEIDENLSILNERLQTASIEDAVALNRQIAALNKLKESYKNAGLEAEKTGEKNWKAFTSGWGAAKRLESSIAGITETLQGNRNAWQTVCGIIDGFIGLYEGVQTIIGIINLLSGASEAHAATKGVEAGAETAEAGARATAAATSVAESTGLIAANKAETASFKELAAAKYMAAHAEIPFAGYGIAAGFTAAMIATVTAAGIPALAEGGVATGPTLALVGEYAGASGNPEVIAPLDKLQGMLKDGSPSFGKVEFVIKGRNLVGILKKENNLNNRS